MYRIIVERSAEKDLRRLPLDVRLRVADALRSLANNPRPVGGRKLAGTKPSHEVLDRLRAMFRMDQKRQLCSRRSTRRRLNLVRTKAFLSSALARTSADGLENNLERFSDRYLY